MRGIHINAIVPVQKRGHRRYVPGTYHSPSAS